jgi:transcriptional regulator with PAS, ATPase and Fis domain
VRVRDLGSKNGTFIREVRIQDALLPPGGEVVIGSSRIEALAPLPPRTLELSPVPRFGEAIGASPLMRALFALLDRAAGTDVPVLLLGETGTGKELLARAVHAHSARKDGPFVVFDCGAVAPSLIEAELFGYVKGAFTGASASRKGLLEEAHGGTVFLDELGELPLELQTRLLRALETRTVRPMGSNAYRPADARVVAATHRNLRAKVAAGTFREDLYFRLAVVLAQVPPLRERREDVPLLVAHFLARQSPPRSVDDLPPGLVALLQGHGWPGNVRELWNTVTRLVLFPALGEAALEPQAPSAGPEALHALPWREAREQAGARFELGYLRARLAKGGTLSAMAREMGVSRQFLYRLLDAHGLRAPGDG